MPVFWSERVSCLRGTRGAVLNMGCRVVYEVATQYLLLNGAPVTSCECGPDVQDPLTCGLMWQGAIKSWRTSLLF